MFQTLTPISGPAIRFGWQNPGNTPQQVSVNPPADRVELSAPRFSGQHGKQDRIIQEFDLFQRDKLVNRQQVPKQLERFKFWLEERSPWEHLQVVKHALTDKELGWTGEERLDLLLDAQLDVALHEGCLKKPDGGYLLVGYSGRRSSAYGELVAPLHVEPPARPNKAYLAALNDKLQAIERKLGDKLDQALLEAHLSGDVQKIRDARFETMVRDNDPSEAQIRKALAEGISEKVIGDALSSQHGYALADAVLENPDPYSSSLLREALLSSDGSKASAELIQKLSKDDQEVLFQPLTRRSSALGHMPDENRLTLLTLLLQFGELEQYVKDHALFPAMKEVFFHSRGKAALVMNLDFIRELVKGGANPGASFNNGYGDNAFEAAKILAKRSGSDFYGGLNILERRRRLAAVKDALKGGQT